MKIKLTVLLMLGFIGLNGQTISQLKTELNNLLLDADLKNATISFSAIDLNTKQVVAELNPLQSVVPASVTKLITTATAIELLGADFQFTTSIYYNGYIDSVHHILHGNIVIRGGGDPALGSDRYEKHYGNFMSDWVNAIKALGIDSINGKVIGDASYFNEQMIPSTWIWGDVGNYYGAGPSGLSIYENTCTIDFVSGSSNGDSTYISCVKPFIPDLEIENFVKSKNTNKDESYFFGGPYQNNKMVKGGIPLNRTDFSVKSSLPDPAFLASYELTIELIKNGVGVAQQNSTVRIEKNKDSSKSETLITELKSPRLIDLIKLTNYYSINLYAEHFMNQIGVTKYGSGDTESSTQATQEFWKQKGIDISGMYLNDGSGLSRFNSYSAKHLVDILVYMKSSKNFGQFYTSIPVVGKSGTVRSLGVNSAAEGNTRLKSGYMTRVRSYAGYCTTKSNKELAFSIMVNNFNCSPSEMKKKLEKIIIKVAEISD
ncbi:MAG: D-alanyl-D-alanine carboxypeptidase/D-alanyl-D-alanine-endopeptidase [Flavobacteriales bacterium]